MHDQVARPGAVQIQYQYMRVCSAYMCLCIRRAHVHVHVHVHVQGLRRTGSPKLQRSGRVGAPAGSSGTLTSRPVENASAGAVG